MAVLLGAGVLAVLGEGELGCVTLEVPEDIVGVLFEPEELAFEPELVDEAGGFDDPLDFCCD